LATPLAFLVPLSDTLSTHTGRARMQAPVVKTRFKVEHGVPMPPEKRGRASSYPWLEMEVGDSFFVPDGKLQTLRGRAAYAGARHHRKFACRPVEGGIRVWRMA
jgi:hypothetical protein